MKKLFSALIFVLAFGVSVVFAAEAFLVCDPQTEIITYNLDIDGTVTNGISAQPDGSFRFDLAGMSVGAHVFKLQAKAQGGWPSDWSDPFNATKPVSPLNLRVSSE